MNSDYFMRRAAILFFAVLFFASTFPLKAADIDSAITRGIRQIYSMDFGSAETTFRGLISDYPEHPAGRFFLAMIDWWKILVDIDNESLDDIFFQKLEDVIYQCDKILEKNDKDVNALFFKGGAIGFRGRLHAIRESWLKAADDGREALPITERAAKLDPSNKDVQLGFGIYNYYASVIPDELPLIKPLMVFFPKGDKAEGIRQLSETAEAGRYSKYEARYFLMTLYYEYEKQPIKALEYAEQLNSEFPDNPVFERWKGRINVYLNNPEIYFSVFSAVLNKCTAGKTGYNNRATRESSYYVGLYYKGRSMADSALYHFNHCAALSESIDKGNATGFQVNSLLYSAMMNDALGNRNEAIRIYNKVIETKDYRNSVNIAKGYLNLPFRF